MYIFELVNKFHPDTGEPIQVKKLKEIRCDFTGEVLSSVTQYASYHLDYQDYDACWGSSGSEFEFSQKYAIDDISGFLSSPYHFLADYDLQKFAERKMIKKYWNEYTFADMCRASRIETAGRLIEEKIITLDQLSEAIGWDGFRK